MEHTAEAQRVEAALREIGWAAHCTIAREQQVWARLSAEVDTRDDTVDDYTNDLCSRDYLELAASMAAAGLRDTILKELASADGRFRAATVEDSDGRLGRHFRIERHDGWWWHRRPSKGPLADFLTPGG